MLWEDIVARQWRQTPSTHTAARSFLQISVSTKLFFNFRWKAILCLCCFHAHWFTKRRWSYCCNTSRVSVYHPFTTVVLFFTIRLFTSYIFWCISLCATTHAHRQALSFVYIYIYISTSSCHANSSSANIIMAVTSSHLFPQSSLPIITFHFIWYQPWPTLTHPFSPLSLHTWRVAYVWMNASNECVIPKRKLIHETALSLAISGS